MLVVLVIRVELFGIALRVGVIEDVALDDVFGVLVLYLGLLGAVWPLVLIVECVYVVGVIVVVMVDLLVFVLLEFFGLVGVDIVVGLL